MKTTLPALVVCILGIHSNAVILLNETFTYSDGVLSNVSGGKWRHTSGGADQVNVDAGSVVLSRSETEDVDASLTTSFAASSGAAIYSRFSLRVLSPPAGANGNYFAHVDGGSARARVFVVTNGAAAGRFRLGVANGSTAASVIWPVDLNTNEVYTVVTRLVVSNVLATLWVSPASEVDTSITASDTAAAASVNRFAWRQDSGMGELTVDNLVVATSFGEALLGNEMPSISSIPDQQLPEGGTTAAIPFAIRDAETASSALNLSAHTAPSNTVTVSFGGSESNRTVTISAGAGMTNPTTVTVFVSDGATTNSESFLVTIVPAILFHDPFNYAYGALITNATPPWAHHSGSVTGQVQIAGGKMVLSGLFTEDVSVLLPGASFATNSGVMLYASFVVNCSQRPGPTGDYFAHFNTTGARCRLFANTANAASGRFRLGLANAANAVSEQLATDLSTNADYRVVLRYDPATAMSKLWIDPSTESDAGISATDPAAATAINAFAFRQDPGIGTLTVDELRIGLTFAAVNAQAIPRLRIVRGYLFWPIAASIAGYALEGTPTLAAPDWQQIDASGTQGNENFFNFSNPAGSAFFRLRKRP